MKKMRKLLAVLAAGVLALCSLSGSLFADALDAGDEVYKRGAEPVYALGKDLSLYPKGDADLDGEVTVYDACLILCHFCRNICGLEDMLTSDQIEAAEVDGKSIWDELHQREYRLTAWDATCVLKYATLRSAGFDDVTMEDVAACKY